MICRTQPKLVVSFGDFRTWRPAYRDIQLSRKSSVGTKCLGRLLICWVAEPMAHA